MPPSRGADRIGVSLGSHRPTVILKLSCLVEKKRTKVRSLPVLFSAANWDRSPARSDWSNLLWEHMTLIRGQGAEGPLDLLTAAQEEKRRLGVPSPIYPTPRTLSGPRAIVSCCFHLLVFLLLIPAKTQPDDVRWLVVRGLLVPAYPKERGRWLHSSSWFSCSPLAAGKESIYLPSFGRFPPTQSTEMKGIPWWISPTTQLQCRINWVSRPVDLIYRGQYIPKGSKKERAEEYITNPPL